jgi:hypothetical protein
MKKQLTNKVRRRIAFLKDHIWEMEHDLLSTNPATAEERYFEKKQHIINRYKLELNTIIDEYELSYA